MITWKIETQFLNPLQRRSAQTFQVFEWLNIFTEKGYFMLARFSFKWCLLILKASSINSAAPGTWKAMATDFNNAGTSQSTQLEKVKTSDADFMTSSDSSLHPIQYSGLISVQA